MARYVEKHPTEEARPEIARSEKKDGELIDRLVYESENSRSCRMPLESAWIEGRRQYAAIPKSPVRNQPIPNAPNVELPIGALISDSLYAQVTDALYAAMPILTVRELDEEWEANAKDLQKLVNWSSVNELGLRFATDNAFQDDIQLGTGILYCPFVTDKRVTNVATIVHEAPRIIPISPEDFFLPGGSRGDHQQDEWLTLRFWYTPGEFKAVARQQEFENWQSVKPTSQIDRVRAYHEATGLQQSAGPAKERHAVHNTWIYHDYNGDGVDLDLQVAFDLDNRKLLKIAYNRYDTRPVETMRFQARPHLFWGLGVMEMVAPLQDSGTDTLNQFLLNMMLCNARMYAARHGTVDDFQRVWPMRIVGVESTDDIKELRMSDVYPSIIAGLDRLIQLAERRVGVTGEFTSGSPASRVLGTRTPGITAMTALQSVNRRFAPAFDGMRLNAAAAVRQCMWRYAERVRAKDRRVIAHLTKLLGDPGYQRVATLFRQDDFEAAVSVEFTAVSASVNRDSDRQNAMLLMQQQTGYVQQIMAAVMQLSQPGVPPMVHEVAKKAMKALNYTEDMFLRTFDQVRNPERMLLNVDSEIDAAQAEAVAAAENEANLGNVVSQISAAMGGGNGGGDMGGGPAAPEMPEGPLTA